MLERRAQREQQQQARKRGAPKSIEDCFAGLVEEFDSVCDAPFPEACQAVQAYVESQNLQKRDAGKTFVFTLPELII